MAARKRKLDVSGMTPAPTPSERVVRPAVVNPLTGMPYSQKYQTIYETRKKLPVWGFLDKVEAMLRANRVIVLEGETGSGKTTQVRAFADDGLLLLPHYTC